VLAVGMIELRILFFHVDGLRMVLIGNVAVIKGIYSTIVFHKESLTVDTAIMYYVLSSSIMFVQISKIVT
jgi:hypothetical protein